MYLRCAFEDYSLELIQGDAPGFDHAGWELRPGVKLAEVGLDGLELDRPGGRSSSLHLKDPDGHGVEIVEWTPRESEFPDLARLSSELPGYRPRKLGHVNVVSEDVQQTVVFLHGRAGTSASPTGLAMRASGST